jgi:hypothetical protein
VYVNQARKLDAQIDHLLTGNLPIITFKEKYSKKATSKYNLTIKNP